MREIKNLTIITKLKLSLLHIIPALMYAGIIYLVYIASKLSIYTILYLDFRTISSEFLCIILLTAGASVLILFGVCSIILLLLTLNHIRRIWSNYLVIVVEPDGTYITEKEALLKDEKK